MQRFGRGRSGGEERGDERARPARATLAALLVVLAGLVGVLVWRATVPGSDGPLFSDGGSGALVDNHPAGSTLTWGMQIILNTSPDDSLVLREVTPNLGDPPVTVVADPMIAGMDRVEALGAGMFDVQPGWPPQAYPDLVLRPVAGASLPAESRDTLEVMMPIEVPTVEAGIGYIDGFTVVYESGGRVYSEETDTVLVICPVENRVRCDAFDAKADAG